MAAIQILVLAALAGFAAAMVFPMQDNVAELPYDQCNTTVGCMGLPKHCIATRTCQDLATYKRSAMGNNTVRITLYSTRVSDISDGDKYISVGFSNIGHMPLSGIVSCVQYMDKTSNMTQLAVYTSYAVFYVRPINVNIHEITSTEAGNTNGLFSCSFDAQPTFQVGVSKFDLTTPTYLIMAGGKADESQIKFHGLYHRSSDSKLNLQEFPTM